MFAYRHYFHAGNFADVYKHAALAQLITHFQQKEKPMVYVDTHSGVGQYDLQHEWAQKNKEYALGVERIFGIRDYPGVLEPYLSVLRNVNLNGELKRYPGSPYIARQLMRPVDRLILNEFNPVDVEQLTTLCSRWPKTKVHRQDGFEILRSVLPPIERRGLIFMDSSFDSNNEFNRIEKAIIAGHKKFSTGVYAVWYPISDGVDSTVLFQNFRALLRKPILRGEIYLSSNEWGGRMNACGLVVINPPYTFDVKLRAVGDWLVERLDPSGAGRTDVEFFEP